MSEARRTFSGSKPGEGSNLRVLLTASLVSSLIMLDSNIVAVSLPAIGQSLKADFTDIQWVISAYVLTYAALLLAAGSYADLRGRRRAMLAGLVIFGLASGACGLAGSVLQLNISRAVQGVGGALLLTASLAVISQAFTGAERVRAFAFWGASLGIALAVGPIIGGAITDFFGWRWVFLVNLPASAVLIVAALRVIDESIDPGAKRLDLPGIASFSLALALLIWALIDGNDAGWGSPGILIRLGAAAVLFVAFVVAEARQDRPMVDLALFRRRTFVGAIVAMLGYGASAQVMIFFLPLFLQNAYGFEPLPAGVAMIPFALPMVLAPRVTAHLAGRLSGRALLAAGLAVTAVGNLAYWAVARVDLPYAVFAVAMLIAGCGAGLLNGQTVKVLQGAAPTDRAGMASGIASTTRFMGILVSVALLGAALSDVARHAFIVAARAADVTPEATAAAAVLVTSGDLAALPSGPPGSPQAALHAVALRAYADGFAATGLLATGAAVFACLLVLLLISSAQTAPIPKSVRGAIPCKTIDCRDPL